MQHAEIADRVERALLELVVAVQGVVREPETEVLVDGAAQVLAHLRAVPVGLPRERLPVEQRLDHDHLSLEPARLDRTGGGRGEQRSEHERPLRIDRRTVRVPELVPDGEVATLGHLVPVVGLGREVAAVVDGDRVAGPDLPDGWPLPRARTWRRRRRPTAGRSSPRSQRRSARTDRRRARRRRGGARQADRGGHRQAGRASRATRCRRRRGPGPDALPHAPCGRRRPRPGRRSPGCRSPPGRDRAATKGAPRTPDSRARSRSPRSKSGSAATRPR